MADTVRTKIRKAVKWGLTQITVAGGYRTTVRAAYDPWRTSENIPDLPAVNLFWGRENLTDIDGVKGNNPLCHYELNAELECLLDSNREDLGNDQDKILADIQEYFGTNFYITGEDGQRTAFNSVVISSEPFGPAENTPRGGIIVGLRIWYNINLTDAETMTHQ